MDMEAINARESLELATRAYGQVIDALVMAELDGNVDAAIELGGRKAELESIIESCKITLKLLKESEYE